MPGCRIDGREVLLSFINRTVPGPTFAPSGQWETIPRKGCHESSSPRFQQACGSFRVWGLSQFLRRRQRCAKEKR